MVQVSKKFNHEEKILHPTAVFLGIFHGPKSRKQTPMAYTVSQSIFNMEKHLNNFLPHIDTTEDHICDVCGSKNTIQQGTKDITFKYHIWGQELRPPVMKWT